MSKQNDPAWLDSMARYGMTPASLKADSGSAMADRLKRAIADVTAAEERFTTDLATARRGGQFTEAGIRIRAGDAARSLLDAVGRWTELADEGLDHAAELASQMTVPPGGGDHVDEVRAIEIRSYLRGLDQLQARVELMEAVSRGDRETVRAALDAPQVLRLLDKETEERVRAAWAERSNPKLNTERAEVLKLRKALLQAVRSLKKTLAEATGGEIGNEDPIKAMALGVPVAEEKDRDPDPIKTMAEG